jgi:hypothetical protein
MDTDPGANDQETRAGAGKRRRQLLERDSHDVRDHESPPPDAGCAAS